MGQVAGRSTVVELEDDLAVFVRKERVHLRATVRLDAAADPAIEHVVDLVDLLRDGLVRILERDLRQPVAVVPGVLLDLSVADSRPRQAVPFIVLRVIVRAIAGELVVRPG